MYSGLHGSSLSGGQQRSGNPKSQMPKLRHDDNASLCLMCGCHQRPECAGQRMASAYCSSKSTTRLWGSVRTVVCCGSPQDAPLLVERVLKAGQREAANGVLRIVHAHRYARPLEVEHRVVLRRPTKARLRGGNTLLADSFRFQGERIPDPPGAAVRRWLGLAAACDEAAED